MKTHNFSFVFICLFIIVLASSLFSRVIKVGPEGRYSRPSEAARFAQDGDSILIDAGLYENDVTVWKAHNLVIKGVGGFAHLKSLGVAAEGKAIWVIKGNDTKVENIEFSGARVPDQNGAGIRQEGNNLEIYKCFFHDNENGILAGEKPQSNIIISHSEFARNGNGDGLTHNMYIGRINSFKLEYSYVHHAKIGHNVKSRAANNFILYNRIMDEQDGTSSYAIDLPNGGVSYVMGNTIQQGENTDNSQIVVYGAEGLNHSKNEIYVVNNTIVNDRSSAVFLNVANGVQKALFANNLLVGSGDISHGPVEKVTNLHIPKLNRVLTFFAKDPAFIDRANFNYRIKRDSPARNAGSTLKSINGFSLTPVWEYKHPRKKEKRNNKGKIDIGAFESN